MNGSLLNLFVIDFEEIHEVTFGNLFTEVGDSILTTLLLCFLAHWVFTICVDLGKAAIK